MDKIEILKKIVERMPEDGDTWYLLGIELAENKSLDEAIKAFTQALKFSDKKLQDKIFMELDKLTTVDKTDIAEIDEQNCIEDINNNQQNTISNNDVGNEYEQDDEDNENKNETYNNAVKLKIIKGGNEQTSCPTMDIRKPENSFSDVGGLEELKETIRMRIIKPFVNPGLFGKFKKKVGGGLLLYGPPGCGKTFIAKATAGECNAKFIPVHITDILDPYIGMSEQNVKEIFSNARAKRPCILFFDEIDTVGFNRAKMTSEHMRAVIDQLLTEIEGIDSSTDKMLIIGATNMPWDVDPAFKRPGRFDKAVFVPPPDLKAREIIFKLKIEGRPHENIDFESLSKNTELYSGADIENVVETATEIVITEIMKTDIERPITMKDMVSAVNSTKPSTIEWLTTIKNYVKYSNQTGIFDDVEKYLNRVKKYI